jgi:hypothetical protein
VATGRRGIFQSVERGRSLLDNPVERLFSTKLSAGTEMSRALPRHRYVPSDTSLDARR